MNTNSTDEIEQLRAHWKSRCVDLLAQGHAPHAVFESLWVSGLSGWLAIYGQSACAGAIETIAALLPDTADHTDIELAAAISDGKTITPTPVSDVSRLGESWRSNGVDLSLSGCAPHDIVTSMLMTALSGYLTINSKDRVARAFAIVAACLRQNDQASTSEHLH